MQWYFLALAGSNVIDHKAYNNIIDNNLQSVFTKYIKHMSSFTSDNFFFLHITHISRFNSLKKNGVHRNILHIICIINAYFVSFLFQLI